MQKDNHITCFISSLLSGGAEHQIALLTSFLSERDYTVDLVTFTKAPDHYKVNDKVNRVVINHNNHKIGKWWAIFRYFLSVQTDWVISFGTRESFFVLLPLMIRKRIKVIAGERNLSVGICPKINYFVYKYLFLRATYIVTNSESQRRYLINRFPKNAPKTFTITNYTSLAEYSFSQLPNNFPLKIGIFSRYEPQKNCLQFVEAVARIRELSNKEFIVEWHGNQKFNNPILEDYFNKMIQLIHERRLDDIILIKSEVKNVSELLKTYDAVALPSLYEGFSNSISEAICCGRPMLVSDVSDNGVMVHDGINGFLFDPSNIDSIVDAFIKYFSLSDTEKQQMGERSREIAERLFDENRFVSSYIKLLQS